MQPIEGAVIAAAGMGTRLGLGLPKCMLDVGGKTLLSRMIETVSPLVPRVHVVVGYREDLVIDHCARHHRDVVIVRNPDFRTTNTASSMSLGARGLRKKALFLDGDLIVSPSSIRKFVDAASRLDTLIGVTSSKSEDAVFAVTEDSPEGAPSPLLRFSRSDRGPWEWANVVCIDPRFVDGASGFVYQQLETMLPLPAMELTLAEVDTPSDLEAAIEFCRNI